MKLLLNASNLRHGGGRTVALQLIAQFALLRPKDQLYVLAPKALGYEDLAQHKNIVLHFVPDRFHRVWLVKLFYQQVFFPKYCRDNMIDKVISLGNVAFRCGGLPQLLYLQLPLLVYPESVAWKRMPWRVYWRNKMMDGYVLRYMKYATAYATQTEVMRQRFLLRFPQEDKQVYILPNAAVEPTTATVGPLPKSREPFKLLFLSRYYAHKGFEILPKLVQILEARKLPVMLTLTLDLKEHPAVSALLAALAGKPQVQNIGPIALADLGKVIEAHHGVFLPTLLESFSGTYAEALLHRRLIFTSHFDFATELLGSAACYFDPLDAEQIADVFQEVLNNEDLMAQKLEAIAIAAQNAPRITEVAQQFSRIVDQFA